MKVRTFLSYLMLSFFVIFFSSCIDESFDSASDLVQYIEDHPDHFYVDRGDIDGRLYLESHGKPKVELLWTGERSPVPEDDKNSIMLHAMSKHTLNAAQVIRVRTSLQPVVDAYALVLEEEEAKAKRQRARYLSTGKN